MTCMVKLFTLVFTTISMIINFVIMMGVVSVYRIINKWKPDVDRSMVIMRKYAGV